MTERICNDDSAAVFSVSAGMEVCLHVFKDKSKDVGFWLGGCEESDFSCPKPALSCQINGFVAAIWPQKEKAFNVGFGDWTFKERI